MYKERITKLKNIISSQNIDALFITNFYNISYFTGFTTLVPHEREAFVLVTKNNIYVMSDGRYHDNFQFSIYNLQSRFKSSIFKLLTPEKGLIKHLQEIVAEEKIHKLGFEKEDLKWSEYDLLKNKLNVGMIPLDRAGVKIRAVKEKDEIKKIKKACEIGDSCLNDIAKTIKVGESEKEIAWKIERWIREAGHEVGFDPIVAVDGNAAIPHYDTKNGNGRIKCDSIVLIDMGVNYQGYNSDITRMFFMGEQPDEIVNAYRVLLDAQTKTIQHISQVKKLSDIDTFCRREVIHYTLPVKSYPHSTGHGVGLEVHEYPKISASSDDTLQPGQVFTIEPGIYTLGKWGMRIEDTIAVLPGLVPEVLTRYPKELE
jgi:Xaa-Pro aminopeptidase